MIQQGGTAVPIMSERIHVLNRTATVPGHLAGFDPKFRDRRLATLGVVLAWQQRAAMRQALASLDSRLLDDMAISASDAWHEVRKPFWQR